MWRALYRGRGVQWAIGSLIVCGWLLYFGHAWVSHPVVTSVANAQGTGSLIRSHRSRTSVQPEMVVYVVGAVREPGLYHVPLDARVADVIRRAGGSTRDADLAAIDLAAVAEDGMEIVVPRISTAAPIVSVSAYSDANSSPAGTGSMTSRRHLKKHHKLQAGERINLNRATLSQLEELPGVGAGRANAILSYRIVHHGFSSLAELSHVRGFGTRLLTRVLPFLTLT